MAFATTADMKCSYALIGLVALLGAGACSGDGARDGSIITLTGTFVAPPSIARLQMSGKTATVAHVDAEGRFTLQVKKADTYIVTTTTRDETMGPYLQLCKNTGLLPNLLPVPANAPADWDFGPITSCGNLTGLWPTRGLPSSDCEPIERPAVCGGADAGPSGDNRPPTLQPIQADTRYDYDANGNYMGGTIFLSTSAFDPDGDIVSIAWSLSPTSGSPHLASSAGTSNVLTLDSIASGSVTVIASDAKGGTAREFYDFAAPH